MVQWYEEKSVVLESPKLQGDPITICKRWSKTDSTYINFPGPELLKPDIDCVEGIDLIEPNDNLLPDWQQKLKMDYKSNFIYCLISSGECVHPPQKRWKKLGILATQIIHILNFKINLDDKLLFKKNFEDENEMHLIFKIRNNSSGYETSTGLTPPMNRRKNRSTCYLMLII